MFQIGKHKIDQPYILAPMAGVSQMPFRRLALKFGAGLAPTELISAKGLFFSNLRTKTYLTYDKEIEKPFCVQLFGGEVESMAVAAEKAMTMGADIIDINMGCPVKKVTKTNAGSALLCDFKRAASIVLAMRKATGDKIPITAKIRSGWDNDHLNFIEVAKALQDAGIMAIAIHPRTRAQGYSGQANWQHIAELKASLTIPVIGNGDVKNFNDAKKMLELTGCDAIMIGRAALGNPWIFTDLVCEKDNSGISALERLNTVQTHLRDHIELHQEISETIQKFDIKMAIRSFRSHLIWYSKGLSEGAKFRQVVMITDELNKINELIHEFFTKDKSPCLIPDQSDDGIDYRQAFG